MKKSVLAACFNRLVAVFSVLLGSSVVYPGRRYRHHSLSFSQDGEDGILERLFERQATGFYVDVGAHHPQRFSNTYRLYLRGWSGINIDPLPGSKARFDALRNRDINLEIGISDVPGLLTYFSFQEPALNTFSPEIASSISSRLLAKEKIHVSRLSDVLSRHLPDGQQIDFLSIDVEGLDLQVLKSNDWDCFRPKYVLAEALGMRDVHEVTETQLHGFMRSIGYSFFAKTVHTLFYVDCAPSMIEECLVLHDAAPLKSLSIQEA